jgi:hypothetical protein
MPLRKKSGKKKKNKKDDEGYTPKKRMRHKTIRLNSKSKFKPEYCDMVYEHILQGGSFTSFVKIIDNKVTAETVRNWKYRIPPFGDAVAAAQRDRDILFKKYKFDPKVSIKKALKMLKETGVDPPERPEIVLKMVDLPDDFVKYVGPGLSGRWTKEMSQMATDYLIKGWEEAGHTMPSLTGLAAHLKIPLNELNKWCERGDKPVIATILGLIKTIQHHMIVDGGLSGKLNAAFCKFILINHFGYQSDKMQIDTHQTIKDERVKVGEAVLDPDLADVVDKTIHLGADDYTIEDASGEADPLDDMTDI